MGKPTGFMEYSRHERSYDQVENRVKHYREFVIPLSEQQISTQGARCMDCGIPYCHNGCPINNIIPEWNDAVYQGDWQNALEVLHSTNNFPEFTGRICPAPCEAACTLNLDEAPVTIKTALLSTKAGKTIGYIRRFQHIVAAKPSPLSAPAPLAWPVLSN